MAFRVSFDSLSAEQRTDIRKDLYIREVSNGRYDSSVSGVHFYDIDTERNDVLLPMFYAGQLFKTSVPNRHREFTRVTPFDLSLTLRDYQQEAVDICMEHFSKWGTAFLNVFCSYGKTIVGIHLASLFSQKGLTTLIVIPRLTIADSWINAVKKYTNAKIYIVGVDKDIPSDAQIVCCMITRLNTLDDATRQRIGHVILDEADCFCTSNYASRLLSIEPMFITCLTATYERDDGMHLMLDALVGPQRIKRISSKPFYVFRVNTGTSVPNPKMGSRGIIFHDVLEQLSRDDDRNELISLIVKANRDDKILIMTQHVSHVKTLRKQLTSLLKPYKKTVSSFFGLAKRYDDADVTIGTIQKIGRGFDQKGGCDNWDGRRFNVAILATSTKKIEQPAGRTLRADTPVIFDLVDNQHNCKRHWGVRKKWYQSRNGHISEMTDIGPWRNHK